MMYYHSQETRLEQP